MLIAGNANLAFFDLIIATLLFLRTIAYREDHPLA